MGVKAMRAMQRLELDFRRRRAASPWAGRVLLAVAVAFAAEVGYSYHQTRQALIAGEAELARAEPRAAPARSVSPDEVASVRESVERIGLPWDALFRAVEAAAGEDVALAGIEPDPKTGTVLITGDGRNYLAALSYVLNLSREEALTRVQLVRHEAKAGDPQGPVSFAVSAAWSEAKP